MSEKKGIKELKELLKAMGEATKAAKKVKENLKDGFSVLDLTPIVDMDFSKIKDGIDGVSEAVEEAKDLDGAEIVALVSEIAAIVKEVETV